MSLLIVLGLAMQLAQPGAVAPTGSITGHVIEEGSQAPVADAQVSLTPASVDSQVRAFDLPLTTRTDRTGRYRFERIPVGRYRIVVSKSGFASGIARPRELTVAPDQELEYPTMAIQRGGIITGRIVNSAGEPAVDARVMALRRPPVVGRGLGQAPRNDLLIPAGPTAQSNDVGEFRLAGLPPDDYIVSVRARDEYGGNVQARTVDLLTFYPGTADITAAQFITVTSGQTFDIAIRLIDAPAFRVSGIVHDQGGRPVANALIRVTPENATRSPLMLINGFRQVHTDGLGRFSVGAIPSGTYTLSAVPPRVLAREPGRSGWSGGVVSGVVGASSAGSIITEMRDGVTTEYREANGTRITVTITDDDLDALDVVVTPAR